MIEVEIRSTKGKEGFRLDCCIEAAEISVDVGKPKADFFGDKAVQLYLKTGFKWISGNTGGDEPPHGKEVQKDAFSEGKRLWEYYHKDR